MFLALRDRSGRWYTYSVVIIALVCVVGGGLLTNWWFPRSIEYHHTVYRTTEDFQPMLGVEYPLNRFQLVEVTESVFYEVTDLGYLLTLVVPDEYYTHLSVFKSIAIPVTDISILDSLDGISRVLFYETAVGEQRAMIWVTNRRPLDGDGEPLQVLGQFCSFVSPTSF